MADYDFSGLDTPTPASMPTPTPAPVSKPAGYDFSGIDDVKDYGTPIEMAKTAAEQALSGATLGGSKVAETKLFGVKPEDIKGREEENPVLSTVANIGGTGAMLWGTGGLGALGEGASLAARVGVSAVEGGLIGGINQATDDWSQDKALDAGKIIASTGIGAALGGLGAGAIEGAKVAPGSVRSALDWFGKFAPESDIENGTSTIGGKIRDAYDMTMEGSDRNSLVKKLKDSLGDLYKQTNRNIDTMYNFTGLEALDGALKPMSTESVLQNTKNIVDTVQEILDTPGSYETGENILSDRAKAQINRKLEILQGKVNPEDNLETHTAITDFTKQISDMIKWEGKNVPTDQGRIDQGILRQINTAVRDNLKNTDIWGKAGKIFSDQSEAFESHATALKDFNKAFTIPFNGKRVISPEKVNSFLAKSGNETQALQNEALKNFLVSSSKVAKTAENLTGSKEAGDLFSESIKNLAKNVKDTNIKSGLMNAAKKLDHGHSLSGEDFLLFETLGEVPGFKPMMAVWRMLKNISPTGIGKGAANSVKLATSLAKHVDSATQSIDKGAQAIFTGSSSQTRKKDD
jgi:hypothetical protein